MGSSGKARNSSGGSTTIDLRDRGVVEVDTPLVYGADGGHGQLPQSVIDFEEKRRTAKIEFSILTLNGDVIEENKGTKHHVAASDYARDRADLLSHNHPRSGTSAGQLGGTFSPSDIKNFMSHPQATYRAVASEGTYSISKGAGLANDAGLRSSFRNAYSQFVNTRMSSLNATLSSLRNDANSTFNRINSDYVNGRISYADRVSQMQATATACDRAQDRAFNNALIDMHNWLRDNQSTYGYTYGLER